VQRKQQKIRKKTGILSRIKIFIERNRLGELLVLNGALTPRELKVALVKQKSNNEHLGKILVQQRIVTKSELRKALIQQSTLRCLTAAITLIISFSSLNIKQAKANPIKDIPAQINLVDVANPAFTVINHYPDLFGTEEKISHNLTPFTKWTSMFDRFDGAVNDAKGQRIVNDWKKDLVAFQNLPLIEMAEKVNNLINSQKYIIDNKNWGKSDYWATPVEFFSKGGDCEDFAIAKYTSLRALGVPEERLRVAIVHDKIKDIPHAVLIVYTDQGAVMLDNQMQKPIFTDKTSRYRPIFSINRQAWWLHTQPAPTIIASAR
jgi:predicted transglutaminase-like cysteine proteinase